METINQIGRDIAQNFCGKNFVFKRTNLRARNFMLDTSYRVTCEVWDKNECEWEEISMSLEQFHKDLPALES